MLEFVLPTLNVANMESNEKDKLMEIYSKRVQRCYGCFIPYHLKDMYLGEDVSYFCENCKDDSMFSFDEYTRIIDVSKLREVEQEPH